MHASRGLWPVCYVRMFLLWLLWAWGSLQPLNPCLPYPVTLLGGVGFVR